MNHAANTVTPPNPEMEQGCAGDAPGRGTGPARAYASQRDDT